MNFSIALEGMKRGSHGYRKGWNGNGLLVKLVRPNEESVVSNPYFVIMTPTKYRTAFIEPSKITCVPDYTNSDVNTWVPSVSDLLADDWKLVGSTGSTLDKSFELAQLCNPIRDWVKEQGLSNYSVIINQESTTVVETSIPTPYMKSGEVEMENGNE